MYPAQALIDGEYGIDDLPDTIIVWIESTILNKAAEAFPSPSIGDLLVYYEGSYLIDGESYLIEVGLFDGRWRTWDERFFEELYDNDCLITSLILEDELIQDEFADTYTVTINPPDDNAGTYTVTRRSICVWSTQVEESGEPAGLKLSYIDAVIGGGFAYTWQIELDTSYIKDGFANTPTGDYAGGNAAVS